jgi:lysophospholipase L1-like esterase
MVAFADSRVKLCNSLGFRVVNPEEGFVKTGLDKVFFSDDQVHPNREGHRIAAELLQHCLTENGLLSPCH